jgi:peptidoglycan/LPS O-acetylase OafA/YrhL
VGRISYGIYVYHVFVIILISPLLVPYGLTETHYAFLRIAILLMMTLGIAALSWHFMEQPFLAWKSRPCSAPERETAQPEKQFVPVWTLQPVVKAS